MRLEDVCKAGATPTSGTLQPLIVRFLEESGPTQRSDLVKRVEKEWSAVGGQSIPGLPGKVKKALANLQSEGIVVNPMHGLWALLESDSFGHDVSLIGDTPPPSAPLTFEVDEDLSEVAPVESYGLTLGDGDQFLYAFYLPTYRELAEARGESAWPMKVGMTTTTVQQRIDGFRTALPEEPVVALVVRTDNAALLEKLVHSVLSLRGRREETGGSEWFRTSTHEIQEIYEFAMVIRNPLQRNLPG